MLEDGVAGGGGGLPASLSPIAPSLYNQNTHNPAPAGQAL